METSRRFFAARPRLRTAVAVAVSLAAGLLSLWHLARVLAEGGGPEAR